MSSVSVVASKFGTLPKPTSSKAVSVSRLYQSWSFEAIDVTWISVVNVAKHTESSQQRMNGFSPNRYYMLLTSWELLGGEVGACLQQHMFQRYTQLPWK